MTRFSTILFLIAAMTLLPGSAMADETIGGACSGTVAAGPLAANGNNVVCVSSVWQYPAYHFGNTSSTAAGIIKWTGAAFQGCTGASCGAISSSAIAILGATATSTNPDISGDLTSGFYSAGAQKVDVSISGSKAAEWTSTGETVTNSLIANSFNFTTTSAVISNGLYMSAANTLDLATNSTKALELTITGNLNLTGSVAGLQIAGGNVLSYPDNGTDTTSLAIGVNGLSAQTVTGANNTTVGYQAGEFTSTGTGNTFIGEQAGLGFTATPLTGSDNTGIGAQALLQIQGAASSDTAIGKGAGSSITTGTHDTIMGTNVASTVLSTGSGNILIGTDNTTDTALSNTTSAVGIGTGVRPGSMDVAIGYQALASTATNGLQNVGIGFQAGQYISTGPANTVAGYQALRGNSGALLTGSGNTAIGNFALTNCQAGCNNNTAFGYQALTAVTTGQFNSAGGALVLASITTACCDTAAGYNALHATTTSFNTAYGYQAGLSVTSGGDNVAIGYSSMASGGAALTGSFNTAVGDYSLNLAQGVANSNTALGYYALEALTTGQQNVAYGYQAGYAGTAVTGETNNTFIGYQTQMNAAGYTNSTALGNGAIITASNSVVLGNSSIATIFAKVTSITGISDRRRKKDITGLGDDLGLGFIKKLKPVSYRYNNGDETLRYGFIAQDIESALPPELQNLVETAKPEHGLALIQRGSDKDRTYRVGYNELLAPIVKATHEQDEEVDALNGDSARAEQELAALQHEIHLVEQHHAAGN